MKKLFILGGTRSRKAMLVNRKIKIKQNQKNTFGMYRLFGNLKEVQVEKSLCKSLRGLLTGRLPGKRQPELISQLSLD